MIVSQEKPLHWAEAFGLSALLHVGVAYVVLTSVLDLDRIFDSPAQTAPSLQITSLSIDSGAMTSPDIGTGSDAFTTRETLAPVADVLEPVAPVTQDAEVAQAATPTSPDPATLTPVSPAAAAVAPEAISPLRPQSPTPAPVAPSPSDTGQDQSTENLSTAPTPGPAVAAPVTRALTDAPDPATPQASEAPTPGAPDTPDPLAADLINRIRAAVGEACLIALPGQAPNGTVSVQIFAADEAAVAPFADEIFAGLTPRPAQTTTLIDPRQCAALDYIRQSVTYPTSPMTLGLDAAQIASNAELTGRLTGTGGRNVTLILVDDNGVVQDLGGYLSVAVNTARFAAPLRRVGAVRDTRQLLLALGTGTRPTSATAQNGQLAQDYFAALNAEIDGNATLALVPFEVR